MGHVRDLPQSAKDIPEKFKKEKWSHLGVNVDKEFEPIYCIPRDKTKIVKNLKDKMAGVDEILLATDEDREGESISWHLLELLKPKVPVKRMVFHEITKSAIQDALKNFRKIDDDLVRAQEARRILDRLVGYTISPLIWKKVAYGLSAGRVQSVAVRMIVEKEVERLHFISANYFGIYAQNKKSGTAFESKLFTYKGQRIASGKDFDDKTGKLLEGKKNECLLVDEALAQSITQAIKNEKWTVTSVEEKPISRKPAAPFITSTLQQEANRKLGLGAKEAMRIAQKLYEEGFITYMRTDSTYLSEQALVAAREKIQEMYGPKYLPAESRTYQGKKVKGAQEAHEAIRPAGTEMLSPEETKLKGPQRDLYELIWKRTVASQMKDASILQVSARLQAGDSVFSASGQVIEFPGFLKVYSEATDEEDSIALENAKLPPLKEGEVVELVSVTPKEHETKPPARFTEASLVQAMEREGIGRPSTYAAVIGTIIDRGYVNKTGGALVPTFTAMIVSNLLKTYLPKYVDLQFTSEMEKSLDDIATGDLELQSYLQSIYFGKTGLLEQVNTQAEKIDPEKSREIGFTKLKGLSFRVGRYGAYVCRIKDGEEQCASLQDSVAPADITLDDANKLIDQKISGADALGMHPESGLPIYVLTGRYGPYVQLGDEEPKRSSLPPGYAIEDIDMEKALFLLTLPRELGVHDDTEKVIKLGIGRFGPYVVCDGDFRSVPRAINFFEMDHAKAMELLRIPKKGRASATVLKELGEYPETTDKMQLLDGKYGPYVKCGKVNASLPEGVEPDQMTPQLAIDLLAPKMKSKKGGKKKAKATPAEGELKAATAAKTTKKAAKANKKTKVTKSSAKAAAAPIKPVKDLKKQVKRRAKEERVTES